MNKSVTKLVVILLIMALMTYISIAGLSIGKFKIPSVFDEEDGIRKGLDLVGGSLITFEAQIEDLEIDDLSMQMEVAKEILRVRLTSLGFSEATVTLVGDDQIRVEIPAMDNPEEAVAMLGSTAQLEFLDADKNVVLDGSDIKSANAMYGPIEENGGNVYYVELNFSSEGQKKFAEATKIAASRSADQKNYIDIVLDGVSYSTPFVDASYASTGIDSESAVISGASFTRDQVTQLANLISSGQLPFSLKDVELRTVGPTLGERALDTSLIAGIVGLILIAVFMIIIYRVPGVVSVISLLFYTVLVGILLALFRVNLSLPGIAGIVLSIGMAVDANVIIFERIKDELRNGKSLRSSIQSGFKRAFTAIIDSNITTLIAAVVLYFFGTGTIVGFAITLGLGVIVSMFTAITVTHILLNCLVELNVTKLKAYGV